MEKSGHKTTDGKIENGLGLKVCFEPVGRENEPFSWSMAEWSKGAENFLFRATRQSIGSAELPVSGNLSAAWTAAADQQVCNLALQPCFPFVD